MKISCIVSLLLPAFSSAIHINPVPPAPPGSGIPYWEGPRLHASNILRGEKYGGADTIDGTEYKELLFATPEIGTYNHAAMISYFDGQFLASWKNSPKDEDQDGQRVLYTQSFDGGNTWTEMSHNGSLNELFPSMASDSNPNVHLFAEPSIIINNHFYVAASPTQFCLYPDVYQDILLLREVFTNDGIPGKLGQIFWASNEIPNDYIEASQINNVIGFQDMDNETIMNLSPFLTNPGMVSPCDELNQNEYTTKCEWCENGCQLTDYPSPLENERCHYIVPPSSSNEPTSPTEPSSTSPSSKTKTSNNNQADVILYRTRVAGEVNHLYAGTRNATSDDWNDEIVQTNIADDVSNINAGNLQDGRAYLVSNAMFNVVRDPLYVSVSADGYKFNETHVVASCEMDVFKSPSETYSKSYTKQHLTYLQQEKQQLEQEQLEQQDDETKLEGERWGCAYRYLGGSKQGGCQYPQAIVIKEAAGNNATGFWAIFSLNKEDIWIAKVPLTF